MAYPFICLFGELVCLLVCLPVALVTFVTYSLVEVSSFATLPTQTCSFVLCLVPLVQVSISFPVGVVGWIRNLIVLVPHHYHFSFTL